jgi:MscS family membrane protein
MERLLGKIFILIAAFSVTYVLLKLVDLLVGQWIRRFVSHDDKSLREALMPIVRGALKGFLLIIASLMTLQNLGVDITGILASLSVVGLALGLAAQDTVANLFGTFTIFIDKPFKIGDRVQISGVDGHVEQINLRSTRVRNLDGHLVTVPNKTMGNATITNVSLQRTIKTTLVIGVTYSTPTIKVKEAVSILHDIFTHPKTHDVIISFKQFADSSLNIEIVHWFATTDNREYAAGIEAFNLQIKERFDKAGIEFAFPTRTVVMKRE